MRIKPVLVPDHDAASLRNLMDSVAEAAEGTSPQHLTEMDYGGGRSPHGGHGLPRDDDDEDAGKPEVLATPATVKKTQKDTAAALTAHLDQAYKDKQDMAEGNLAEFAPAPGDDGDDDDDGFDEATLKRMAAHWYQGDEDPRIEQLLAAAGWEIGQDEGYEDEPGVFVVMSGDENGRSYISWPAAELQGVTEGEENSAIGQQMARDGITYSREKEGEIISQIGDYLRRNGMTPQQVRGYMIDTDFIGDQLSYLPRKSAVAEADVPYNDPNLSKAYNLGNEAYTKLKNHPELAQAAQDRIEKEFPQYAQMWTRGYQDGERFDREKSLKESCDPLTDLRRLLG